MIDPRRTAAAVLLTSVLAAALPFAAAGQTREKAVFQTNWRAEAEQGGFYQAWATGIYKKYGLDAEVRQGGPQQDPNALLIAGKVDFIMSNSFAGLNYVKGQLPFLVIATSFQKDPQVLIAHPGMGNDSLAALKGKPIMISAGSRTSFWPFLRARFGFTDDQIRPYTFTMAPFLANKAAIQQGFLTNEPFQIEKAGVTPVVLLLADAGFANYQETINTSREVVEKRPDYVQRFVNASIEGWYSYLYGDPSPGNAIIKSQNPDMTDDVIAYTIKAMKERGIVDSGDSKKLGIGAMTDERWAEFYKSNVEAGSFPADLDVKQAYTLNFVNKRVGM